ncbi:MAG: HPr family phosphocarrier protein [Clostridia bacterium]|nr:HPr family phosphocarrier protein [Clostridia bacterium]
MKEFSYVIKDSVGIHARPAGLLVKEAGKYKSDITLFTKGKSADAKKLFSVMSLSAKTGDELKVSIFGSDEDVAELGIRRFLEKNL